MPSAVHVVGVQVVPPPSGPPSGGENTPHTLGLPAAPQNSGAVHVPQERLPPHPSPAGPQLMPRSAQVFGTQAEAPPHTLLLPPPPQVSGDLHVPQLSMLPHPSPWTPQL